MDTDGFLIDKCYEIATVFPGLGEDIIFLCRSLGLSVSHGVKVVDGKEYQRIFISGNTGEIPCITRKKAGQRKQIKNPLRYGLDIEYIGKGEYYGFLIDGNHLYMLADFTVTHNTAQELEYCRQVLRHEGGKALIVLPLGVRQEFARDARDLLQMEPPRYITTQADADAAADGTILMTNYERVRDGDIDPKTFSCTVLDEASCLRSYGSKTFQTFMQLFRGVKYKLVCTATPSPNKYKELIHYAGYLEVMDTGQALTRFFQRDSTKANNLTLYPHKEEEFWLWVSSWALFIQKPSDLGYDDTGYDLPGLEVREHIIQDSKNDVEDRDGQFKVVRNVARSLSEAAAEKRESINRRVEKAKEIVDSDPDAHFILWHDLEAERHAIKKAMPEAVDIYGSMDYDTRERRVIAFSDGECRLFATKKSLSGSGCNFQRHCHRAIFVGIDYEFNDFIQAIHRTYRFLQSEKVIIDVIYTETEQVIWQALQEKWRQHDHMQAKMQEIVKKYGLTGKAQLEKMARSIGVKRVEIKGKGWTAVNDDCVEELKRMETNSVGLIHTSIPFSNHYEYTPSYNDFGHNEDTRRFFEQMDYLSPELLRVLQPGRVFACHVKDRVLFGNATGYGMPSMEPFHAMCIQHYQKHGFIYFGMITVVTDVVRENNQTYRLGWTEQCKDGSKMGVGCPEYILLFRKLPTNTGKAYADEPVKKTKQEYTRAQWQIDAHGFWRSSGDKLPTKQEVMTAPVSRLQKVYREYSRGTVYDYEEHVQIAKKLDEDGHLPATFMVVAPGSWSPEVWDDVNRMRTLNTTQSQRRKSLHVCPLQLDIVDRIINRYSNESDLVLDPFGGLGTVALQAIKHGRRGYTIELNNDYFRDAVGYLKAEDNKLETISIFDLMENA
ncbi:MAG: DNA methylase N-4 [Clostridiales bacterium]|nr:DNA methylase N-4 [Clostridiales bacterium]